jgi:uncharacterized protein YdhG (YjbR/CyaY superfamily)
MLPKAKNIDAYLEPLNEDVKAALERLRKIIKATAPDCEEVISYAMPAFKYHGMLIGFAAAKNHCALYPWSGRTVEEFRDELKDFSTSKGTIRFTLDRPLPETLIKKIVRARMKANLAKDKAKSASK